MVHADLEVSCNWILFEEIHRGILSPQFLHHNQNQPKLRSHKQWRSSLSSSLLLKSMSSPKFPGYQKQLNMHLFQEKQVLDHRKTLQAKFLKTVANSLEVSDSEREAFHNAIGTILQAFLWSFFPVCTFTGALECKGQRQVKIPKGILQRKRTRSGRRKVLLSVQQGHVQAQGLQVRAYLQQMLQEGSQCFELQGEQPGYYGHQLTNAGWWRWNSFTEFDWRRNWEQSVPNSIYFFTEQPQRICFCMGQKAGLTHGYHSSSRNDWHQSASELGLDQVKEQTSFVKQNT